MYVCVVWCGVVWCGVVCVCVCVCVRGNVNNNEGAIIEDLTLSYGMHVQGRHNHNRKHISKHHSASGSNDGEVIDLSLTTH